MLSSFSCLLKLLAFTMYLCNSYLGDAEPAEK